AKNAACLLGDREFVGREWFRFLKRHRIKFQMRLHKNTLVRNGRGQYVQAWRLFCRTRINCPLVIPEARKMWGMELYLSGCRLKDGEYLILVSAEFCEKPHEEYRKRWGINIFSRHNDLVDQALRHCLALFKQESFKIIAQQSAEGLRIVNDLPPMNGLLPSVC